MLAGHVDEDLKVQVMIGFKAIEKATLMHDLACALRSGLPLRLSRSQIVET